MNVVLADRLRDLRLDVGVKGGVDRTLPRANVRQSGPHAGRTALLIAAALACGTLAGGVGTAFFRGETASKAAEAAPPVPAPAADASAGSLVAAGFVVPRRGGTVGSQMTGQLREILVKEGDHVAAGQVIARIDDADARAALSRARSEAVMARAALAALGFQHAEAKSSLARKEALGERGFVTLATLDESRAAAGALGARIGEARANVAAMDAGVRNAEVVMARYVIRAPFAGVVIDKNAEVGELVSPVSAGGGFTRTGVVTIVDMASLGVEVDVNEAYIGRVTPGQPVALTLDAFPGERFRAAVSAIVPAADRNRATVRVDIALLDHDPRILPQMGAKAAFLPANSRGDLR